MILFINTNTNVYPYYPGNLEADYPEYNVYQPMPNGVFPVTWIEKPEDPDPAHYYELGTPISNNGVYTTNWELKERQPGTYITGPGPWSFDEESKTWYLTNPLAKDTYD
jgi:hypothetical protein